MRRGPIRHRVLILVLSALIVLTPSLSIVAPTSGASTSTDVDLINPQLSADAAIAVDLTTGTQLYALNADMPLPPASTIKIVAMMVVRNILPLDQTIVIQESDLVAENVSQVGLLPGDTLTVRQLLYGALVVSGGDAVKALARVAGHALDPDAPDPMARFVVEMNAFADRHGMAASDFSNPTGLDDPGTMASARDLVRATRLLFNDWLLRQIVSTPFLTISVGGPNAREIELWNTNQLVQSGEAIGVKTGTEINAGECLIIAKRIGSHLVVVVVLGSVDRYADVATIMATLEQQVEWVQLGSGSPSLGAAAELQAQGYWMPAGRTILMTEAEAAAVTYEIKLEAAADAGSSQGNVTFSLAGEPIAILPVYSAGEPVGGASNDEQPAE